MTHTIAELTKYGRLAASTRQRFEQYDPFLVDSGCKPEPFPLLDDEYLNSLYSGQGRRAAHMLRRYLGRAKTLIRPQTADLFWVHCELFPFLPGLFERMASLPRKPIIFDFDDAIFHNYDQHRNPVVRALLGRKLVPLLRAASAVFCGNEYLRSYAAQYNANTHIIPTVLDTAVYRPRATAKEKGPLSIGWIGTPSTWTEYMDPMMPLLAEVAAAAGARITTVGAGRAAKAHPLLDILPWSEAAEVGQLQDMDIGLMPLNDSPWARGKCGYKLIQFMACGLPVVASPVGVNASIVEHGVNGFLATTDEEWRKAITSLLGDADLRKRMGAAGRRKIEAEFSLHVWGPIVARLIRNVAEHEQPAKRALGSDL